MCVLREEQCYRQGSSPYIMTSAYDLNKFTMHLCHIPPASLKTLTFIFLKYESYCGGGSRCLVNALVTYRLCNPKNL